MGPWGGQGFGTKVRGEGIPECGVCVEVSPQAQGEWMPLLEGRPVEPRAMPMWVPRVKGSEPFVGD